MAQHCSLRAAASAPPCGAPQRSAHPGSHQQQVRSTLCTPGLIITRSQFCFERPGSCQCRGRTALFCISDLSANRQVLTACYSGWHKHRSEVTFWALPWCWLPGGPCLTHSTSTCAALCDFAQCLPCLRDSIWLICWAKIQHCQQALCLQDHAANLLWLLTWRCCVVQD